MAGIEVEIKSHLKTKENAEIFRQKIELMGFSYVGEESQLNHYFTGALSNELLDAIAPSVSVSDLAKLRDVLGVGNQSVRTRQIVTNDPRNPVVLLIVKIAIKGTSENGTIRKEVEIPVNASLDRLDDWLLEYGLSYQSKWSRQRFTFVRDGITATIDKNAGYGWLAELEMMTTEENSFDSRTCLLGLLKETGFEELDPDLLNRMFAFYSANWQEYYGTDKTFDLE